MKFVWSSLELKTLTLVRDFNVSDIHNNMYNNTDLYQEHTVILQFMKANVYTKWTLSIFVYTGNAILYLLIIFLLKNVTILYFLSLIKPVYYVSS